MQKGTDLMIWEKLCEEWLCELNEWKSSQLLWLVRELKPAK